MLFYLAAVLVALGAAFAALNIVADARADLSVIPGTRRSAVFVDGASRRS